MQVLMGFLLLSFVLGGREIRRDRPIRMVVVFGLCVIVTLALRTYRYA